MRESDAFSETFRQWAVLHFNECLLSTLGGRCLNLGPVFQSPRRSLIIPCARLGLLSGACRLLVGFVQQVRLVLESPPLPFGCGLFEIPSCRCCARNRIQWSHQSFQTPNMISPQSLGQNTEARPEQNQCHPTAKSTGKTWASSMEDVLFSWKITGHYRYFGPGL